MVLTAWMKLHTSLRTHLGQIKARTRTSIVVIQTDGHEIVVHARKNSLATGAQLAMRGRRDMSSRLRDVVLGLALCHNVGHFRFPSSCSLVHSSKPRSLRSPTTMAQ